MACLIPVNEKGLGSYDSETEILIKVDTKIVLAFAKSTIN
jgi:hypothetical protein